MTVNVPLALVLAPSTNSTCRPAPAGTGADSVDCGAHENALSLQPPAVADPFTSCRAVSHVAPPHTVAARVPATALGQVVQAYAMSGPRPHVAGVFGREAVVSLTLNVVPSGRLAAAPSVAIGMCWKVTVTDPPVDVSISRRCVPADINRAVCPCPAPPADGQEFPAQTGIEETQLSSSASCAVGPPAGVRKVST